MKMEATTRRRFIGSCIGAALSAGLAGAMSAALKGLPALQTTGSATVWVRADGFQARNLTIENAYNRDGTVAHAECKGDNCPDTTGGSRVHHQAVALRVDGADKAQFERVRLLGLQDTLFLGSQDGGATVRSFFHATHVEGDVDFIFGDTIAVFKDCDVHAIGGRAASYVAAPDTDRRAKDGFVVDGCRFSGDPPVSTVRRTTSGLVIGKLVGAIAFRY